MPIYLQILVVATLLIAPVAWFFKLRKKNTSEEISVEKNGEELEQEVIDFFEVKTEVDALKGIREQDKK